METPVRVTLKAVARRAGVHPGTASRALNSSTRDLVSPATAERVLAAARELGYRPDAIARSLKTRLSNTVGVLIPDLANPFFPPMVRGMQDRLEQAGYTALVVNTENDPAREKADVEALRARQVDGYISATARLEDDAVDLILSEERPLVLINREMPGRGVSSVVSDDRLGMLLAVRHLAELGHRRIAFLGGPMAAATGQLRFDGFHQAAVEFGLEEPERLTRLGSGFLLSEGGRMTAELIRSGHRFSAVVAANDLLALGCLDALVEHGLSCPNQVSVIGFNDMPFAERFAQPLTTIRVPQYEIGARAGALLVRRLRRPLAAAEQVRLEPVLVVRGSTAPPP